MDDIIERIGKLLTQVGAEQADVRAEAELGGDLGLDSLALVEFGLVAEKEFGVKIADNDISLDDTVDGLARLIVSKAAG